MKMTKRQTKVLLATIFCANILNSTVLASPADEAKMFAEQFKKPIKIENNIETNNIKTNKTAEEILSDLQNKDLKKENISNNVTITKINETPDKPIEIFGEGINLNYKYNPVPDDDVSLASLNEYSGPKYNFDWQGAALTKVFYALGRISNTNIVVVDADDLSDAKVYATFNNVTIEEIIRYLTATYGLNYTFENGNYIIAKDEDTMLQSQRFLIHFANKEKIKDELKALGIDEANIYANDQYGAITVTGNSYELQQAERLIKSLDKPVSQCLIVAQLIETTHSKDLEAGLNYTMPTYTHNVDDPLSHQNWGTKMIFGVTSSLNEALTNGKVLSRPVITTENGNEATLFMGDRVPIPQQSTSDGSTNITFDYQDVGTTLKIKPAIDKSSGVVSLNINTEIKNITKYIEQGGMQAPQISSREAETIAHLKSGQTFIIGGLMSKEDFDTVSGIPVLRKLPILGKLFEYHKKNKSNTEVFIAITPYIIGENDNPNNIVYDLKLNKNKDKDNE